MSAFCFFFFKQKTAYEISACLVGSSSSSRPGRSAEETAMMEDGTVLEWGRTSDLFYHPQHLHTEQFISSRFA